MREYEVDESTLEGAIGYAMDQDGLTFGEAVALLTLSIGYKPENNNPGVFENTEPIK